MANGLTYRKRTELDSAAEKLNETMDYYVVQTGKSIVNGIYNSISWGASKVLRRNKDDSFV